jgi:2-polyprenyl-3-methyl-5-hydroxy-6-metoxy-1,4-benzoquinol methylase
MTATDLSVAARLTALTRRDRDPRATVIQQGYLRWLPRGSVVDVGCGEGGFLTLARAQGFAPFGIDLDATAIAAAVARGHDAACGEATAVLTACAASGRQFAGALLAHVLEHNSPEQALLLLEAIAKVLPPGGVLVVATPDPRSHLVLAEGFWLDPTHVRPYPRLLVERLLAEAGFAVVASYRDPATRPPRRWWAAVGAWLRSVLSGVDKSGPLDLVVVGRRTAQMP